MACPGFIDCGDSVNLSNHITKLRNWIDLVHFAESYGAQKALWVPGHPGQHY